MGIFDRIGSVISSNFNALLDKVDDPKKSIEHLLEEMQGSLRAARQEIVRAVASEKQLKQKVAELDVEAEKWRSRAELALASGDEALAREALVHRQRVVGERDRAEALAAEQRGAALQMKAELSRMEQKTKEFSARKSTIATQVSIAREGSGPEALGRSGGGANPFAELRRMEDQIEGVEASVQAQRELDEVLGRGATGLSGAEVEAKFRALEARAPEAAASTEVEAELTKMKQRIRVK